MEQKYIDIKTIFDKSNVEFIDRNKKLLIDDVAERSLCGALAQVLSENIKATQFLAYYVDVDYNRNNGEVKEYLDENGSPVTINCDLIIHSRATNINEDNILTIEMKKSYRSDKDKISDKKRIIALTKDSYDNKWKADGKSLPKYVCGYKIGVYYEIDKDKKKISIEYYYKGQIESKKEINY